MTDRKRQTCRVQQWTPSRSRIWALVVLLCGLAPRQIGSSHFAEKPSTLHVPSRYLTLKECVARARHRDEIRLQAVATNFRSWDGGERGWHSFQGRCFVTNEVLWRKTRTMIPFSGATTVKELADFYERADAQGTGTLHIPRTIEMGRGELRISGDEGVRVNGQLVFGENTTGAVQGPLTLALLSDINWALEQWEPRYVTEFKCAVIVHGAWRFDSCQIRASGGTALRSDKLASTRLTSCALGGVLAYDTDGRLCRASRGICATAHSQVFAEGCAVEHTEVHKSHHVGGTGVRVSACAQVILEDCHLHSHSGVAVQFDEFNERGMRCRNEARVLLSNCVLKQADVAMFSARGDTRGALLRVAHSTLYASTGGGVEPSTWANDQRPGTLEEDGVKYLPPDSAKPRALECFRALFSYVPSTPIAHEDPYEAWWRTGSRPGQEGFDWSDSESSEMTLEEAMAARQRLDEKAARIREQMGDEYLASLKRDS